GVAGRMIADEGAPQDELVREIEKESGRGDEGDEGEDGDGDEALAEARVERRERAAVGLESPPRGAAHGWRRSYRGFGRDRERQRRFCWLYRVGMSTTWRSLRCSTLCYRGHTTMRRQRR